MFNREQAAAYLAAMIDGEGWIGEPKGPSNRAIRIANTDPELISAIREACDALGISYTVQKIRQRRENWSSGWVVDITGRENFLRVLAEVPLRSSRKLDRLQRAAGSFRPAVDVERLTTLYQTGLTMKEVAVEMGLSLKRVINAMNAHKIERRRQGNAAIWRTRRAKYGQTGRRAA